MGDLNRRDCLIHLDDIIIFSPTFEQHLQRLEAVFANLSPVEPLKETLPDNIIDPLSLCSKDWRKAQHDNVSQIATHLKPMLCRLVHTLSLIKYLRKWDQLELRNGVVYRRGNWKTWFYDGMSPGWGFWVNDDYYFYVFILWIKLQIFQNLIYISNTYKYHIMYHQKGMKFSWNYIYLQFKKKTCGSCFEKFRSAATGS